MVVIMLIIFSIVLRKQNKRINEEFKAEDNGSNRKTANYKIDSLEDSDVGPEGGSE